MNFNPELTSGAAVLLALFAAFMWGTWAVSLKYLGNYPIDGFYVTLFTTSIIFVWTVGLIVDRGALVGNIATVFNTEPLRVVVTFICGILYVLAIRFSLIVMKTIGLTLSQPISSAILNISILFVTISIGGMPKGASIPVLVLATLILIAAVMASLLSGHLRSRGSRAQVRNEYHVSRSVIWRVLGLTTVSSLLLVSYSFAVSFGMASTTQPHGMAVLPFMAVLATGAFVGAMLSSGTLLTIRREWHHVWSAGFDIHKFGVWSGLFHFGGNIIQAFASVALSAAIAFPLGITSGLWTQLWGLRYGEFKGAPPIAYVALFGGIVLYIIGAYLIASMAI
jgi:hypothetical protein